MYNAASFSTHCLKDESACGLAACCIKYGLYMGQVLALLQAVSPPFLTFTCLSKMHLAISLYHISLLEAFQHAQFSLTVTVCLCSYIMKQRDPNAPNISSNREKYSERIVIVKYIWDLMRKLEIWRAWSKCLMVSLVSSSCLTFKTNCFLLTPINYVE